MKRNGWYASRSYPHFDLPLRFEEAKAYVSDPSRVRAHSFHPFLRFDLVRRRYRAGPAENRVPKRRPISVAAHLDGHIFAYYAKVIGEPYERRLVAERLGNCVLAYRAGRGSNIEFAKSAFDEIAVRDNCAVIALDLEDFFGSIGHRTLKRNWEELISTPRLPADHYAVFKAITRYAEVSLDECCSRLGIRKGQRMPRPICAPLAFRTLIRRNPSGLPNLVRANVENHGIPQGSQISAVLSNVYMLRFDREMRDLAETVGGSYRRYSDDILWICPPEAAEGVESAIQESLARLGGTTRINEAKTERRRFFGDATGNISCDRPVQYLGFTYDGRKIRIRSQTLSKYARRVVYALRAARREAERSAKAPRVVYRRKIYRQLTHLGRRNLISYAKRSEKIMGTGAIRTQVRRHMPRIVAGLNEGRTGPSPAET